MPFKTRNWLATTIALCGILGVPGIASSASTAASLAAVNSLLLLTEPGPDLVVIDVSVSDSALGLGDGFTIDATTKNQGNVNSASTTLRYYSSTDSTITTGDNQLGSDAVGELLPGQTQIDTNKAVTAPNSEGIYWIGACVDEVIDESNTNNQCSTGKPIIVPVPVGKYCGQADLIVEAPTGDQPGVRKLQIEISADASVLVTGEDNNVPGALAGPIVTAEIPIEVTGTAAGNCVGTLNMTGEVALPNISGSVPGFVLCSGVFTNPIRIPITGTFSVTKSTEDCDLTPAP